MRMFEDDIMTDSELSELLAMWTVPEPPPHLRERVVPRKRRWFAGQVRFTALAFTLQTVAIAGLMFVAAPEVTNRSVKTETSVHLTFYRPHLSDSKVSQGGGGSGETLQPVKRGNAPRHFVAPALLPHEAKIPSAPAISAPTPELNSSLMGDPLSKALAGQGNGSGTGLGGGIGNGYRDGFGGGTGGSYISPGGDISAPVILKKIEPEYSEEARKAKFSGTVKLSVLIDEHGIPRDIRVVGPLGMGLDEKAVEAVSQWRFRPAMKGGQPIAVTADVAVSFRLL